MDDDGVYRPLSRRRVLLIVVLAITTAFTVLWMLLERPGGPRWKGKPPRADASRCAQGQSRVDLGATRLAGPLGELGAPIGLRIGVGCGLRG